MGGDDLGSDDEFLTAPLRDDAGDYPDDQSAAEYSEREEEEVEGEEVDENRRLSSKRQIDADNGSSPNQARRKRQRKENNELRRLGVEIREESKESQANLLSKFSSTKKFLAGHVAVSESSDAPGMMKRIQGIISKKKLKSFNQKRSPLVVIICISARRAVEVLKELAPFNVRAAKLFAKHMDIEEQKKQLESSNFGLAVGTPHRIAALVRQGAITFEHTRLVVLDTFRNTKDYAVYTLPDTVAHTRELLNDYIHPQCGRRKDLRIAFL